MKILPTLLSTCLVLPVSSYSDDTEDELKHPWLGRDFHIQVGAFFQNKDIKLSARGSVGGDDYEIDFDETFGGGDSENVSAINFKWDFGQKWWMGAEIYASKFEETAVLEKDIEWNDFLFPAGSFASGGSHLDVYRVVIGRDLFQRENAELGVGLGLHWLDMGAFIEGEVLVDGGSTGFRREAVNAAVPLPNITLWYFRAFSPKWGIYARGDWFSASFNEYSGSLVNVNLGVNYQFTPHLGVNVAYKYFNLDVDADKDNWYGRINYQQTGPFVSLSANW